MTRRQAAAAFDIPFGTLCSRIWMKLPYEKVFEKKATRGQWCLDMFGMHLRDLAKETGLKGSTIYRRMAYLKWPKEDLLKPSRQITLHRSNGDFIEKWEDRKKRRAAMAADRL